MGKATRTDTDRERREHDGRATPVPHDHAAATRDPRTVLGNRSVRRLLAQPKLVVGASFDPLEIEADRVAAEVVRTMAAGPAPDRVDHACGADCSVHGSGPAVARTISRVPNLGAAPIGAAGGEIQTADEATVNRARGGGAALPADFRARVEPVMGADFSRVRVHTGPVATQLNRSFGASAFTVGNDIFFRDRAPDVTTSEGAHLVTHELTHTIQQGGADAVARFSCSSTDQHVQRHSSFEHLMLGNVKPEDLAKIGAWEDAIEQTKAKHSGLAKKALGSGGGKKVASVDVNLGGQQLSFSKADILHVLLQEMVRLKKWQRAEPKESSAEQANQLDKPLANVGKDPTYDVVTIMLPQGFPCTYGEMNTLADYFGSIDVLKTARPKQVWQLLQSVRDETWGFLSKTFDKVAASLTKQERNDPAMQGISDTLVDEILLPDMQDGGGFQDATAFRISGMAGQIELLGGIQGTGAQGETNKYTPSLGRNACHFVPESWHAWAANHKQARALAGESKAAAERSATADQARAREVNPQTQGQLKTTFEAEKKVSTEKANEALMVNGFGDHYLQDSYAAGHMINKTQIMQFYIEFIDKNKEWDYFKDENWRKVQNVAYGQVLAPAKQYDQNRVEGYNGATGAGANKAIDPQSVENRSNGGDWRQNFTELGLKVPRSLSNDPASATRQVLREMRGEARAGKDSLKGSEIISLMQKLGFGPLDARMAVGDMVLDGVLLTDVDVAKRGRQMAGMRDKRSAADAKGGAALVSEGAGEELALKEFRSGTFRLRPELKPKKGAAAPTKTEDERQDEYSAITYNDYLEFITSAFLQKSTNALHDTFCKNGLTVADRAGTEIGRVYGDDSMFAANSSMGVAHSGVTSQMSRDAILNIINTGNDGGNTEQAIVDRFPRKVRADVYDDKGKVVTAGVSMDIEAWHNEKNRGGLKGEAFKWIFPSMSWGITQKLVPGAKGELGTFFTAPAPHVPF